MLLQWSKASILHFGSVGTKYNFFCGFVNVLLFLRPKLQVFDQSIQTASMKHCACCFTQKHRSWSYMSTRLTGVLVFCVPNLSIIQLLVTKIQYLKIVVSEQTCGFGEDKIFWHTPESSPCCWSIHRVCYKWDLWSVKPHYFYH